MKNPIAYTQTGVNYKSLDSLKLLAQEKSKETSLHLKNTGGEEVSESRGESAYIWEEQDCYRAFVIEGLGTKSLVADDMRKITGKTYYDLIAQDTVAAIINDLIVVGAKPQVINAYFATGNSEVWEDKQISKDLVEGFAKACNTAKVTWGGGETPGLKGIIMGNAIELAGACIGIIKPKERITLGKDLRVGDLIILIESSGIHANGLSLAREVASQIPKGYVTKLPDGSTYGESLLTPTHIYSDFVQDLFEKNVEVHYMVNITGHGFRKLMRAERELTYELEYIFEPQPIFKFLKEHSLNSDKDMYATFNMGAGFAVFVPERGAEEVIHIAGENGFKAIKAGAVKEGPRKVIIKPLNIEYSGETLGVR